MKTGVPKTYYFAFILSLLGAMAGYLVFHPYLMIAYSLSNVDKSKGLVLHGQWRDLFDVALSTFKPFMFPMSISFMVFGAIAGFLIGVIIDKRRRLHLIELENERRRAASETLHQLMVTLSHYLLNANMIIGGTVRHCRRAKPNAEVLLALDVVEKQARTIDAVIRVLQKVTEFKTTPYTSEGQMQIIDIVNEITEELKGLTNNGGQANKKSSKSLDT